MLKATKRTVGVSSLFPSFDTNVRQVNNYDLRQMLEEICVVGRILKPFAVKETAEGLVPLQGNRRTRAAQWAKKDPSILTEILLAYAATERNADKAKELKANVEVHVKEILESFEKIEVIVYKDLTPEEELSLILDHNEKTLATSEVLMCVWRLDAQFKSEQEIGAMLYHTLAKATGNERKLSTLPTEPKARAAKIQSWLHGTLGNYYIRGNRLGGFVREQMMLTFKADDGLLAEGEVVKMRCTRPRLGLLLTAKLEDKDVWTADEGSPKFNTLIKQFMDEDAGKVDKAKANRPSMKDLDERIGQFNTKLVRGAFLYAKGETSETSDLVKNLAELDVKVSRDQKVFDLLAAAFDKLPEPYKSMASKILDSSLKQFEEFLETIKVS